ncbi:MAG: response regulator transcription factor [Candidatus Omnitrophica bacterium]|nr:response regulator transcription factor [Candidatus Omnitrophota bacterium]
MPKQKILVVDDEEDILKLLQYNLQREGYQVRCVSSGEEGLAAVKAGRPDLVVLDWMLPGMDGLEVCKLVRADKDVKNTPILMLTAKDSEVDQVLSLEIGATDYVAKPFSVKVLLARVRTIFRNQISRAEGTPVVRAGELALDKERQIFSIKGKPVPLTKLEFKILSVLMENPGRVFSRDKLLDGAWEGEAFITDRTVDVHVKSIRRKMGKSRHLIETVRGSGYRFAEERGGRR